LPAIDPPLTAYVLSAPWTQQHEAQLWINNPFTSAISITLTQTLPTGITLLNTDGASQNGNSLTWNTVVSPTALKMVTFTFNFPAVPGAENTLPAATLSLIDPLQGQALSAQANAVPFQAIWPLSLDYMTPGYVLPARNSQAVITLKNWLNHSPVQGTLTIRVTDPQSITHHIESKPFNVAANGTGAVNFTLPGFPRGYYLIHGQVSVEGASAEAFVDRLQVGLPGPLLDYRVSPPGVAHPNEILTYTLRFTNTVEASLTGAVITASLPASVTVVAGTVTGGEVKPNQVRWTLGSIAPGQAVALSFAVQVKADAAPSGVEPGRLLRLLSEPLLTANEIAPTWGPLAWNLVTKAPVTKTQLFLPLVFKNR
jgi:uncharacterized repeat protein (TIGR01451 family)